MELIWCPPGSFIMGPGTNLLSPAHSVVLTKGFYLGKYEVTQEEYEKVIGHNPSEFQGKNLPVEMVSWKDSVAFCKTLTRKERKRGWEFTLPTEAQWEYACRAGTTTAYSWGDSITTSDANHNRNLGQTTNVGQYSANPWGFYDMHGNVREWCQDWFGPYAFNNVFGQVAHPAWVLTTRSWKSGSAPVLIGEVVGITGLSLGSARLVGVCCSNCRKK